MTNKQYLAMMKSLKLANPNDTMATAMVTVPIVRRTMVIAMADGTTATTIWKAVSSAVIEAEEAEIKI